MKLNISVSLHLSGGIDERDKNSCNLHKPYFHEYFGTVILNVRPLVCKWKEQRKWWRVKPAGKSSLSPFQHKVKCHCSEHFGLGSASGHAAVLPTLQVCGGRIQSQVKKTRCIVEFEKHFFLSGINFGWWILWCTVKAHIVKKLERQKWAEKEAVWCFWRWLLQSTVGPCLGFLCYFSWFLLLRSCRCFLVQFLTFCSWELYAVHGLKSSDLLKNPL